MCLGGHLWRAGIESHAELVSVTIAVGKSRAVPGFRLTGEPRMIREALVHVASRYLAAINEPFKDHPLANYLRDFVPPAITEALGSNYYLCKGSPGQGNWADVPWIGIFDPTVTTSATRGYYVVYLFSADMQNISLALGQGTTIVREEFKRNTHDALNRFAGLMRDRLPEARARFQGRNIDLRGRTTLAHDYEPATAISVTYDATALPSERILRDNLKEMVRLYALLIARGGRDTFEDTVNEGEADSEGETILERRRYRQHRKLERNSRASGLAKRIHGFVCQCCGFDFEAVYGVAGAKYIEAHHLTPLSELPEDVPVSQDPKTDFCVLCANCHRMIHRKQDPRVSASCETCRGLGR